MECLIDGLISLISLCACCPSLVFFFLFKLASTWFADKNWFHAYKIVFKQNFFQASLSIEKLFKGYALTQSPWRVYSVHTRTHSLNMYTQIPWRVCSVHTHTHTHSLNLYTKGSTLTQTPLCTFFIEWVCVCVHYTISMRERDTKLKS